MTGDYCSKSEEGGGAREAAPSHAHTAIVRMCKRAKMTQDGAHGAGRRRSERRREKDGAARGRGKLS